jgi:PTS system nitrogen regulatory IIA component
MRLTIREASRFLGVNEDTAARWIGQRGLPAHRVSDRWYVHPMELWEWAVAQGLPVSRALLDEGRRDTDPLPSLVELLREGGVFHDVPGDTKADVLHEVVARLPLPPEQDRPFLLDAREALGSTGIGDGIAIPHVRNPIVLNIERPFVTLCLLRKSVPFDAIDGQPVHALFVVISPSVPAHLRILASLGFALHDKGVRDLLRSRAAADAIMARLAFVEETQTTGQFRALPSAPTRPEVAEEEP